MRRSTNTIRSVATFYRRNADSRYGYSLPVTHTQASGQRSAEGRASAGNCKAGHANKVEVNI